MPSNENTSESTNYEFYELIINYITAGFYAEKNAFYTLGISMIDDNAHLIGEP